MGGFTAIGSPDVLNLVSGAQVVQTIWSDTTVHQSGGTIGTKTVVEKIIPAGTLRKGGAIHFRFDGHASMVLGLTLNFNWDGNDVLSMAFISPGNGPFYMDIVLTHNPASDTAEVLIAKTGNWSAPLTLTVIGAYADITHDIPARLNAVQVGGNDGIQLAFAYAALLNSDGPV